MHNLASLPHPVYFVRNHPELCEKLSNISEMPPFEEFYCAEQGGSSSWIVQTYLQLKCRGLDVHLVPYYVPDVICVVSREELMKRALLKKSFPFKSYLVVCQQDRPRPFICEQRIVQNQLNVLNDRDHYLPHWSQPDLEVRNRRRGDRIETLTFKGRWYYLPEAYKNEEFANQLRALGVQLITEPDYNVSLQSWCDYSEVDVLLAVRHRSELYLSSKPPTKLINAWMAGCPALLGAEPAYQELRRSELDYIEVNSPGDVVQALQRLKTEPRLYQAMIENGWQRAEAFSSSNVATLWRTVLAEPIATGYERWMREFTFWKMLGRPPQFGYRLIQQERERRQFNKLTGRKR